MNDPKENPMDKHEVTVYRLAPFTVAKRGSQTWQAVCDVCGPIGVPDIYEADVQAVAERHAEIGGFG